MQAGTAEATEAETDAGGGTGDGGPPDVERKARADYGRYLITPVLVVLIILLIVLLAYALAGGVNCSRRLSFGVFLAGSAFLSGGLVGLLFGIPRKLMAEHAGEGAANAAGVNERAAGASYGGNTNLEQISDWLTKILVGVGLVEYQELGALFERVGKAGTAGFYDPSAGAYAAQFLALSFCIGGFMLGYLVTRLYLGQALTAAEAALQQKNKDLTKKVDEQKVQDEADKAASQLAAAQLGGSWQPLENLTKALEKASPAARARIFFKAEAVRVRNWSRDKEQMEKVIPIFKALTQVDAGTNQYHRNHAQLGFALMEQRKPDYKAAKESLDKAIEIRDAQRIGGWTAYEACRAYCQIKLDEAFKAGKPCDASLRDAIMHDINIGDDEDWVVDWFHKDEAVVGWLRLNDCKVSWLDKALQADS